MGELKLVKQETFDTVKCDFYKDDNEVWMTRKQIGKALKYAQPNSSIKNIHLRHQERFEDKSRVAQIDTPLGGVQNTTIYNKKGMFEICRWSQKSKADDFIDWVWDVIDEIMETGSYSMEQYDTDYQDIAMLKKMIDTMEANRKKADEALQKTNTLEHRVDSLDATNIDGDLKDRFNSMIRKYALEAGKPYGVAWGEFYRNYNRAYSTNLKLRITNHKKSTGKKLSAPKLLEKDSELEDAIRVADKMLSQLLHPNQKQD